MFFFFKQKTAYEIYQCDWSSDVCSSDLAQPAERRGDREQKQARNRENGDEAPPLAMDGDENAGDQITVHGLARW